MQARVEPPFLFDTLARVRQLYDRDPDTGDRVLDELIADLRAAMPRMRDTSSTVQQEVDLVRAWLAIARDGTQSRVDCACDFGDDARAARLPPMMLLPLVERFVAQRARPLRLEVAVDRGRLRLLLEAQGPAPPEDDAAIVALRERLAVLHGNDATLAIAGAEGRAVAVVDLPFDPMPDDPAKAATDRSASASLPSSGSTPAAIAPTPARGASGSTAGTSRT
jgi:LytS/YehU family sensor histidine kinase